MAVRVRQVDGGYRIDGDWDGLDPANAFLAHLSGRGFSPASVRAYGFDGVNLARFLSERMAYMHMRGLDTRVGMWSSGRFRNANYCGTTGRRHVGADFFVRGNPDLPRAGGDAVPARDGRRALGRLDKAARRPVELGAAGRSDTGRDRGRPQDWGVAVAHAGEDPGLRTGPPPRLCANRAAVPCQGLPRRSDLHRERAGGTDLRWSGSFTEGLPRAGPVMLTLRPASPTTLFVMPP